MEKTNNKIIDIENISKIYTMGNQKVYALRDITLNISENEYVAVM